MSRSKSDSKTDGPLKCEARTVFYNGVFWGRMGCKAKLEVAPSPHYLTDFIKKHKLPPMFCTSIHIVNRYYIESGTPVLITAHEKRIENQKKLTLYHYWYGFSIGGALGGIAVPGGNLYKQPCCGFECDITFNLNVRILGSGGNLITKDNYHSFLMLAIGYTESNNGSPLR